MDTENKLSRHELTHEQGVKLLEAFREFMGGHLVTSDALMARTLGVKPPAISRIRCNHLNMNASIQLSILKVTGWTAAEMAAKHGEPETVQ